MVSTQCCYAGDLGLTPGLGWERSKGKGEDVGKCLHKSVSPDQGCKNWYWQVTEVNVVSGMSRHLSDSSKVGWSFSLSGS